LIDLVEALVDCLSEQLLHWNVDCEGSELRSSRTVGDVGFGRLYQSIKFDIIY
jgi:hypothetical protein